MHKTLTDFRLLLTVSLILLFACCRNTEVADGTHCANIERYNPKTQKQSSYTLTVDIKDGKLVQINYPNGGHMDTDDMPAATVSGNEASFSDRKGVHFRVELIKKGDDCFADINGVAQCTAKTKKGKRCKNVTGIKNGRCHSHQ